MTELIIHNAIIRTMAETTGQRRKPSAVAVQAGRITALGTDEEILGMAGDVTTVIDAEGGTLTPGLIDSHMHPVSGIEMTQGVDLGGLTTLNEVLDALAGYQADLDPDEWLRGWNLDYKVFETQEVKGEIFDSVTKDRPLLLLFFDVHTSIANAAALEAAGIDGSETFDDASEIVLDAGGTPTGELREMPAFLRVANVAPQISHEVSADAVQKLLREVAATGVTGATVLDAREETTKILSAVEKLPGGLPVTLDVAIWHQPGDTDTQVTERIAKLGERGERWEVRMIKMFIDGVIDAGTAWLHEPDTHGESTSPFWKSLERYAEVCRTYHEAGYQLTTHSCGDAGVAHVARVYESLITEAASDSWHRVEHLETLTDEDVDLLVQARVIASMQPLHMQWRERNNADGFADRLGPVRAARTWRVKDILRAGGRIALGSDWPVAGFDARVGMAWARLRRLPGDPAAPVFEPDQCLTGEEALLGYTRWAAEALGRDDKGVIKVGAVADMTLWETDPITAEPDELPGIAVLLTTVNGSVVHRGTAARTVPVLR